MIFQTFNQIYYYYSYWRIAVNLDSLRNLIFSSYEFHYKSMSYLEELIGQHLHKNFL